MTREGGERQVHEEKGRRIVFFPCPLQGHMNPMLQLATLLHSKGFSITIIHTQFNSPNPSNFPNFSFEPISDGIQETSTKDFMALLIALNIRCEAPFRDCLARILSENKRDSIVCIISDAIMHFTQAVANHLKLPRIVLRPSPPSCFIAFANFPLLRQKGYLPIKDPQSKVPVSELPPLRVKDIPTIDTKNSSEEFDQLIPHMISETLASSGLILNSLDYLERTSLTQIQQDFSIPTFPVGPLHKYSPGSSNSLLTQDPSCIAWLDNQVHGSVIYVSFGSLADMEKQELVETAWGLANSDQPFLWVIRPGSVGGLDCVELPEGFEEKTRGRGCVVKWAPQQEVLAHPAVGGFWTHCGWNSTLESICEGVPMLCWPSFGDQRVNARYLSHVWRVGLELENGLERGEIERAIRRLMVEKEGEEMRKRVKVLKENAESSIRKGGSSQESLERLVDYILSF
ncbi:UDP-glycosyltransferase 76B1-like [Tasmannia lanceolata]|uniref:UDP-glycosyltransferase 76B1-like n=1 Tax=Tasmannia lanceolata TaxID=3420 RepID=UPI00406445C8